MANTNITSELLDSLLAGRDPKTVFEQDGLLDELKKALAERILSTEWITIWVRTRNRRLEITATAVARRRC